MKTKGLFLGVCSVLVATALVLAGCDDLFTTEFTFINESSYTVTVSPSGHSDFTLRPGNSKSIKDKSSSLSFIYSPANSVKTEMNRKGKIRFVNLK
ncbi:MAG: hypothetical protein LBG74_00800 [Spirochaetaceae bacterium]|jgi:hypothetical protein|nr:hypothetical protein [Spirochaetaceae bacterium]